MYMAYLWVSGFLRYYKVYNWLRQENNGRSGSGDGTALHLENRREVLIIARIHESIAKCDFTYSICSFIWDTLESLE